MMLFINFAIIVGAMFLFALWAGPRVRDGRMESQALAIPIATLIGLTPILVAVTGVWEIDLYIAVLGGLFVFVISFLWIRHRAPIGIDRPPRG